MQTGYIRGLHMLNLKANDQKPPKNKPTIETDLSEAAEKSDPPYSQEYLI